jgi:hypothetical protein
MLASNYINNHENLLSVIFSYLDIKELANLRTVSKIYNKVSNNFNGKWKNACFDFFYLNNESHR